MSRKRGIVSIPFPIIISFPFFFPPLPSAALERFSLYPPETYYLFPPTCSWESCLPSPELRLPTPFPTAGEGRTPPPSAVRLGRPPSPPMLRSVDEGIGPLSFPLNITASPPSPCGLPSNPPCSRRDIFFSPPERANLFPPFL